jgi:hypothetical protein
VPLCKTFNPVIGWSNCNANRPTERRHSATKRPRPPLLRWATPPGYFPNFRFTEKAAFSVSACQHVSISAVLWSISTFNIRVHLSPSVVNPSAHLSFLLSEWSRSPIDLRAFGSPGGPHDGMGRGRREVQRELAPTARRPYCL